MIRIALVFLLCPALALATYEPEETAVAALVDAARGDRTSLCNVCKVVDSSTDCAKWGTPKSLVPYHYQPKAADAGRFHSKHMHDGPCFQHESCCELGKNADGSVSCRTPQCSQCDGGPDCPGTEVHARYVLLGWPDQAGENIAAGYGSPLQVMCGWMNSEGHRLNILGQYTEIGVGLWREPGCMGDYWTQSFGDLHPAPDPGYLSAGGIQKGSFGPPFGKPGDAATAMAYVADPAGNTAPQVVRAIVDGRCIGLSPALGTGGHALYSASFAAAPGCHEVWFSAIDAAGGRHVFPPQTAMAFAVGDASCPAPAARTPAACEGADACTVEGATKPCYSGPAGTAGKGLCHGGHRSCTEGAYGACEDEVRPATETCNGLDDDCDGEVDEGVTDAGKACTTALPGRCAPGHTICAAGGLVCVPDLDPVEETCNGQDDDCDGEVDDGLGTLTCGDGGCRTLVPACTNGVPGTCPAGAERVEVCGNGLDDDCDGAPDDGCPCNTSVRSCYAGPAATLGVGACKAGVQRCENGVWGACEGAVIPSAETCNGKDDDCDKVVDEGFGRVGCGTGACRTSTAACVGGVPRTCEPAPAGPEKCNGVDDSCDGSVDEGCLCRSGAQEPCFSGDWTLVGVGTCRAGAKTCAADGSAFGACAGQIGPVAEVCRNGLDDDCNGLVDDGCPPVVEPPPDPDDPRTSGCGCGGSAGFLGLVALVRRRRRDLV